MLKFYHVRCTTYVNGINRGTNYGYETLTEEEKAKDFSVVATWKNIAELYYNHALSSCFHLFNFKRGKYLSFDDFNLFKRHTWDIAEWRHPEMKIELKFHYEEIHPSIKEVLHYHNGEKAMQYLLERGMNFVKGE